MCAPELKCRENAMNCPTEVTCLYSSYSNKASYLVPSFLKIKSKKYRMLKRKETIDFKSTKLFREKYLFIMPR